MNKTLGILFYVKRAKIDDNGKAPIYVRITVDGIRSELSIKRSIELDRWIPSAGKVKGTNEEARSFNSYIDTVRTKIYDHQKKLMDNNKTITSEAIKNSMLGIEEKQRTIVAIFQYHNKQVKALVGKEFAAGTLERYETVLRLLQLFLEFQYKVKDMPIHQINHKFITDLEFYLKTERDNCHNTAIKYIKNFKKIVRIALANGWIDKDPFVNFKATIKDVEREFLTEEEIQNVISKDLHFGRLDQVRDIFIFCCFTGLAYADVKKLSNDDLVIGIDGSKWIKTNRTKTDVRSNIPLLPTPLAILEKYKDHPEANHSNKLLPVLSNQKMNAYLKEISTLCEITKNFSTHLARHTFATTVTLTNGVSLESVSKMLGHKSIKTTQHYAKIVDRKVSDDMLLLKAKYTNNAVQIQQEMAV
ncbi:MAG TPA: site-specific integrase [Chitinophagales bacterium]|jgi:site-specific recombinase XerD|nr:site-specific integrase [Chitinophagales bacterium]